MPDMPKGVGKIFFSFLFFFSQSRDLDPGDPPASASFWTRGLCYDEQLFLLFPKRFIEL